MKRILILVAAAGLLASMAGAQTADEIIAKYLAARGGVEKIKAVQSQRIAGHLSDAPFRVEFKRPLKMHMEIKLAGRTITRILNGTSGWFVITSEDGDQAREMSADEAKNASLEVEAAFGGAFLDYKARGVNITLAGREKAGESEAWKIDVTYPEGTRDAYFIDSKSYAAVKWEGQRTANGQPVTYESWFRSFLEIDGLKFANVIESGVKGDPRGAAQTLTIDKIELNVALEDNRFSKPTGVKN